MGEEEDELDPRRLNNRPIRLHDPFPSFFPPVSPGSPLPLDPSGFDVGALRAGFFPRTPNPSEADVLILTVEFVGPGAEEKEVDVDVGVVGDERVEDAGREDDRILTVTESTTTPSARESRSSELHTQSPLARSYVLPNGMRGESVSPDETRPELLSLRLRSGPRCDGSRTGQIWERGAHPSEDSPRSESCSQVENRISQLSCTLFYLLPRQGERNRECTTVAK